MSNFFNNIDDFVFFIYDNEIDFVATFTKEDVKRPITDVSINSGHVYFLHGCWRMKIPMGMVMEWRQGLEKRKLH